MKPDKAEPGLTPEQPREVAPSGTPRDDLDAPQDVLHDAHEAETSREARDGEEIAESSNAEVVKARRMRELPDHELIALGHRAAEAEHWLDVARRSQAELENVRKRAQRETSEAIRYAVEPFARELLAIVDNLERAVGAGEKNHDFDALFEGISMTHRMFLKTLEKFAVRPVEALHRPFDPAIHEAMMTVNDPKLEDNAVAMELEKGWTIHDRVLRAAKVSVNKKN